MIYLRSVRETATGPEFVFVFRDRVEGIKRATARMLRDGRINEVWIGDEVWLNDPDRAVRLADKVGTVGMVARKAEEVSVLLQSVNHQPTQRRVP